MQTTVGQLLVNEALPPELRDYTRQLDKKSVTDLARKIYDYDPNSYKDTLHRLMTIGMDTAHNHGSSISLNDLRKSRVSKVYLENLNKEIAQISGNRKQSKEERDKKIVDATTKIMKKFREDAYNEGLADENSFALQVKSGARGNPAQLGALRAADLLVADHRDRPIAIPIVHSYSEGLDPVEYWAAGYGSRKGEISKKMAVADAGFLAKQLNNAVHRLIATSDKPLEGTGLPVDATDDDNIGAVLAADYGTFKAGTVITPAVHKVIKDKYDQILVHSPIVSSPNEKGGIPALAVGVRERGRLPRPGENVGLPAAQALSEKLSQAQLSMKHTAGVVGGNSAAASFAGFNAVNQIIQVPKAFTGAATLAKSDGYISKIETAPQGGHFVHIGSENHYVPADKPVTVKVGDQVEAGDMLSDGIPNPSEIVHYKGVGEGRRYMTQALQNVFKNTGVSAHRRNVETLARGLINHVRVTDPDGINGHIFDDVVEYDKLAAGYEPRDGSKTLEPKYSKGMYLEKPVLHYTIGTRITPRVVKELNKFKVPNVVAHSDAPQFIPEQHRAMDALFYSDDWMTSMGGFSISKILQQNVQRGAKSDINSFSYIPGLAEGVSFGKKTSTPY